MFGTTAMLMGPWQERHGPRRGLLLGSIIFAVGQGIASLSLYKKSIAGVYVGYGVLGGFGLGLNYICPVSALQKYFPDFRGVASGFAVAGFGAGAVVWSKVYLPLMDRYKLPETFAILGATLSGAMLLASVFMRTPPNNFTAGGVNVLGEKVAPQELADMAFRDAENGHGHVGHGEASVIGAPIVMTLIQSMFCPDFLFMYLMFFANQLFGLVVLSRLADMAEELFNQTANEASNVVSINGVFNCLARLVLPMLADLAIKTLRTNPPFARKLVFVFNLCIQVVIVAVLPTIIDKNNYDGFRAVIWTLTFTYGGGFGTIPCFLTDMFGPYNIGPLHGMILTAWSIGGVGGGLGFTHVFNKHKPSAANANVPGAYDTAYKSNFRWILAVVIFGLVMLFFVRTNPADRFAPGWRYSLFGKKIVHIKGKDHDSGKVADQNGSTPEAAEEL
jgi:MFS family permease